MQTLQEHPPAVNDRAGVEHLGRAPGPEPMPGPGWLKELAASHRLRRYRDACGDWNIPGLYGEIFWHGPGQLGVQTGGPRANGSGSKLTPAGANGLIRKLLLSDRWRCQVDGAGEGIFVAPAEDILVAARLIKARRKRSGSVPSPEAAARGRQKAEALRQATRGRHKGGSPGPGIDDRPLVEG